MDETQPQDVSLWFEAKEHDDPDYPSGRCVSTGGFNNKCVFLDKLGRCVLQVAATEERIGRWALKPLYCVLYPVEIMDKTVRFDDLLQGDEECCSVSGNFEVPLFQVCRGELINLLGSEGFERMSDHYKELPDRNAGRHDEASTIR